MTQEKSKSMQMCLVLIVLFALMYTLNAWMPLHRDDYEYSLVWNTSQHLASLGDVGHSLWRHYLLHGGRMVSVFCLDLFLWLGKFWFDVFNAALFVALVVLMYFHACRRAAWGKEPGILALTACLAWLSFPHFGEVAVWKSGSTVYLWAGFFVILFLLPYNFFLAGRLKSWGRGWAVPLFFLGILAGWSVENVAVTVVVVAAVSCWQVWRQAKKMPLWMPAGALGALLGLIGIVAAPGNYVRYGQQGQGKGLLMHIGNQFAGNGEMLLYLLPVILLLLLAWRILKADIARQKGIVLLPQQASNTTRWILLAFILALTVSYFQGGFIAAGIRDFLVAHLLAPLHLIKENTLDHFNNIMAGFEEMAIYWLMLFFLYSWLKQSLNQGPQNRKILKENVTDKEVWQAFPEVRYAGTLLFLAFFNNLVMVAAPTFPARATFGSVVMILIAAIAVLRMPLVEKAWSVYPAGLVLRLGGGALVLFLAVASLTVLHTLQAENDLRIVRIQEAAARGEKVPTFPPIALKNRALRHVFFVDFDNGVTKDGLCRYYGIKNIKVDPKAPKL